MSSYIRFNQKLRSLTAQMDLSRTIIKLFGLIENHVLLVVPNHPKRYRSSLKSCSDIRG